MRAAYRVPSNREPVFTKDTTCSPVFRLSRAHEGKVGRKYISSSYEALGRVATANGDDDGSSR